MNQLIYKNFSKNLVINKDELRQKIKRQLKEEEKKYDYNLSEIVFKELDNKKYTELLN